MVVCDTKSGVATGGDASCDNEGFVEAVLFFVPGNPVQDAAEPAIRARGIVSGSKTIPSSRHLYAQRRKAGFGVHVSTIGAVGAIGVKAADKQQNRPT